MSNESAKVATLFLEANFSDRIRSVLYSIPLLIMWLPGLLFERDKQAYQYALVSFMLCIMLLAGNLLVFMLQGLIDYSTMHGSHISDWVTFVLSSLLALGYLALSGWMTWLAWQSKSPNPLLLHWAEAMAEWLKR